MLPQNRYLNYLIDQGFQGVNRLFVLPFENETDRKTKQQKLDADPKAIQQINFTWNLEKKKNVSIFFLIGKTKEANLGFLKGAEKCYDFIWF